MDSGIDTWCVGRHVYAIEKIQGYIVTCCGFSDNLLVNEDLPIINIIYAYDSKERGKVILLQLNYCVHLGDKRKTQLPILLNYVQMM